MFRSALIALGLCLLLDYLLRTFFSYPLAFWQVLLSYFLFYTLIDFILPSLKKNATGETRRFQELPFSGPLGQRSKGLLVLCLNTSAILSLVNPFQLWQQIRQIAGMLSISKRFGKAHPLPDFEQYPQKNHYTLPFSPEHRWYVYKGGPDRETSHSWDVLTQRYAYDFVVTDDQLKRHLNRGTALEDYFCYRLPICSVAEGEVVAVRDGVREAPFLGYGIIDFLARDFRGNHITIRHAEEEYSFYAHLIPGSLQVQVGDQVSRGQVLGACGHSGHSSEPHLHFHLQDGPDFFTAMGLPIRFSELEINDQPAADPSILKGGMQVRATQPDS